MSPKVLIFCALLALASCEIRGAQTAEEIREKYAAILRQKVESMNDQVQSAHKELKNKLKTYISEGKAEIDAIADAHVIQLRSADIPESCKQEGLQQLDVVRKVGQGSFFTCSNLTTAIEDVGQISWNVVNFVSKTLIYLDNVLNGMSECTFSYWIIPTIKCYISYFYTAISDMTGFVGDIKTLLTNIASLSADIKNQIDFCRNGPQNKTLMMAQKVLTNAHLCSSQLY